MRVIFVVLASAVALVAVPVGLSGAIPPRPTVLPNPGYPAPVQDIEAEKPRLVVISSRYRDPAVPPPDRAVPPAWTRKTYRGTEFESAARQPGKAFLIYGGRYLVAVATRNRAFRYAYDFAAFTRPPNGGEFEPLTWAREVAGVLYVSNSHLTYATATRGRNAYVTAVDLKTKRTLWRSPSLVANARTFVVTGDFIVAGYGFTAEPDYLYLLDRRSGKVLERLPVPSAPEVVKLRGDLLHVWTYDRRLVVRLRR